ncbi:MAG: HD-GYP domain-containing protein [Vicinamibacterales bacterium]
MKRRARPRRAPRFVVRTLAASFATVAVVLSVMFGTLVLHTREVVRNNVVENLEAGQRELALFEKERQQRASLQATVLTEAPTLKAALDTYLTERTVGDPSAAEQAKATLQREISKLGGLLRSDIVAVIDPGRHVLASAGVNTALWPPGQRVRLDGEEDGVAFDLVATVGERQFRVVGAPIHLGDAQLGTLLTGTQLDDGYASQLASFARTNISVVVDGEIAATTLPEPLRQSLEGALRAGLGDTGTLLLDDEPHAFRRLQQFGNTSIYATDSVAAATDRISSAAVPKLVGIAVGSVILAAIASLWLARETTEPIRKLSADIEGMVESNEWSQRLRASGSSAEVDGLITTFNKLIEALEVSRSQTEAAYVGSIRALATALDARDTYTAGHSERVSALSVALGRKMGLSPHDLDVLRLGALLHDIGKIGISDAILCKPNALTADEFEIIKTHPTVGAQILRSIPFLEEHIPIVELHHENPDGSGYPHGYRGQQIPLLARIVHVADAFDAMTSARAYRQGRPAADAMTELWRCAGSQFHADVVEACGAALPATLAELQAAMGNRDDNIVSFARRALSA